MQNIQKNALFTCKSAFLNIAYCLTCFKLHYWKYLNLLRNDILELQKTGRGVEMQAVEVAERNRSVLLCRVKTWPQLMCCALV